MHFKKVYLIEKCYKEFKTTESNFFWLSIQFLLKNYGAGVECSTFFTDKGLLRLQWV